MREPGDRPDDDLLARLVGDVDRFFAERWRRRFTVFPGAGRFLLPEMPTLEEVDALISGPAIDEAAGRRFASFPAAGVASSRRWLGGPLATPAADEAINLPEAERWLPRLAPLAGALARRFAAPANLQLFLARAGAGLRPHSDIHDSFILQITGRKRWQVEDVDAAAPRPLGNAGGAFGAAARTIELEPGDVLYKPSHGLHATTSLSPRTLSLTASVVTLSAGEALRRWLDAATAIDPVWSIQLPPTADELARLAEALADLPGLLPDAVALVAACRPLDPDA